MSESTALAPAPAPLAPMVYDRGFLPASVVVERTKRVREVMEAVMKTGVHFGTIPGTQKPTLYQPGADVIAVTFRIAPKIANVEDLSIPGECVRYRVTVRGIHQQTEEFLGEGTGECSSDEEKYRWRKPVCDQEWHEAPEDRRREKWFSGQKPWKGKQIRTSPADVANTVLKMAVKRGKIAMILNVTAASDVFSQDLEDLSKELVEQLADEGQTPPAVAQPRPTGPAAATAPATSQPDAKKAAEAPAVNLAGQAPVPAAPRTKFRRDNVRVLKVEPRQTTGKPAVVDPTTGEEREPAKPPRQYWLVTISTNEQFVTWSTTALAALEGAAKVDAPVDLDCITNNPPSVPTIEKVVEVGG
jgi:hypothetical protein